VSANFEASLRPSALRATLAPAGPAGPQGPPGPPGGFTQQAVVTGSRAANTVYRNTHATAMLVLTTWDLDSQNATVAARSDATTPPATEVAHVRDPSPSNATTAVLPFVVLPGNYYLCAVTGGTPTLQIWVECW